MQLEPLEQHVLARGLEDHTDSTTYYVRAVIRNAKTDAIIPVNGLDYVNLTDNGNRRFTKTWQVPADPTGQGLWLLVTYTVYTDSGYTTKSELYGEKFEEHLILHRPSGVPGGGADIDYKRVRKIVQEELEKLPEPEKAPKLDLSPVLRAVGAIQTAVSAIHMPEVPEVDLRPLHASLKRLESVVGGIVIPEIPPFPETDLAPVLEALNSVREEIKPNMEGASKMTNTILSRIKELSSSDFIKLEDQVKALRETYDQVLNVVLQLKEQKAPTPQPEEINFAELLKQ